MISRPFAKLRGDLEMSRADLRAALAVLQDLVNYDNGGSGDGGAILEAAEKILASHKDNTPVQSHEEKQG